MSTLKAKELRARSVASLNKELAEKLAALSLFRFSVAGGKAKNVKVGRSLRKDIARILTVRRAAGENR